MTVKLLLPAQRKKEAKQDIYVNSVRFHFTRVNVLQNTTPVRNTRHVNK